MRYLSVCAGIEAASVAWHPLGWQPAAFSEIEPFPRAVLAQRWPGVPLHGDFTTIGAEDYGPVELIVGGTPCQSFSIAGLRGGLGDDRGNLALEFLRLAQRKRPRWLVWENVPGVLSSSGGRDFGSILGGLVELGYGFAYRVLDAQHFGIPQRRRRIFVVGYLGDWRRAAAVLFERHSLSGHPAPRREARQAAAGSLRASAGKRGGIQDQSGSEGLVSTHRMVSFGEYDNDGSASALKARDWKDATDLIAHTLHAEHDASEELSPTLRSGSHAGSHANGGVMPAVAFNLRGREEGAQPEVDPDNLAALRAASGGSSRSYVAASQVRRLTPRECERLQGFPDDYTLVEFRAKPAADGPRYKALGNSMAVPVMRWIGERIAMVDALP